YSELRRKLQPKTEKLSETNLSQITTFLNQTSPDGHRLLNDLAKFKQVRTEIISLGFQPPQDLMPEIGIDESGKLIPVASLTQGSVRIADVNGKYITIEGITCVDAQGNPIESYDSLQVRTDVERAADGKHISFTPYQATTHFEKQNNGLFLPSPALTCNILATLYANKSDQELNKILMQYKDHGAGWGWQGQNGMVDWGREQIIQYPNREDYTRAGGNTDINTQRQRKTPRFHNQGFNDSRLDNALKNENYKEFMQSLTGLPNPDVMVEIGEYFGKTAKSRVSSSKEKRAVWLGYYLGDFDIYASLNLDYSIAARGVRISPR
ncbi:hypothetical protein JW711_00250, partial [Candidatus Woesearchaeota archaeon]|nr:hypothetical protein [Candidatus Woesearchaeota archaeon]